MFGLKDLLQTTSEILGEQSKIWKQHIGSKLFIGLTTNERFMDL